MVMPAGFMVEKFKPMKIKNVDVVYADKPGRNRNVYSAAVLKEAITYYKKLTALDPTYKYSFAKHPKDNDEEWLGLIAAAIDDIYFNDSENIVQADFTLLPTIWGQFIAWLLDNEYHIGISLRGKAEAQQATMQVGDNIVPVKQRYNLRLEGVDFVVYPSYIVTHASKENISEKTLDDVSYGGNGSILPSLCLDCEFKQSEVLEHFINDTANEYGLLAEDIKNLLTSPIEKKVAEETLNMDDLQVREARVQVEGLNLEKSKVTAEIAALREELEQYTALAEEKRTALADMDSKIGEKQQIIITLNQLEDKLNERNENLTVIESKLLEAQSNLERMDADYKDLTARAEKQTVVRLAGKTFSSDAPPRIRVIEAADKTTGADWSQVNTAKISQLVSLSKDEEIAGKVFAVAESVDNWNSLKLPVYQAFKSESDEFDIDMVLNSAALHSAMEYINGRKGMGLNAAQKTKAINFVHSKYNDLEATGLHEIPASIKDTARRAQVIEKITFDDPDNFTEAVIESAIINGIVVIDEKDVVKESADDKLVIKREIAHDNIAAAIVNTILGINRGRILEAVAPQGDMEGGEVLANFVNVLITAPDGSPTDFSEAFGIESVEDFTAKYVPSLNEALANNDVLSAMGMIQMVVSTYTQAMVDASDDMNVSEHINTAFQAIASAIKQPSETEIEQPGGEELEGDMGEVQESTNEENTDGGEDEMLFADLKAILEKRFEGVQITTPEEATSVVEKLIADYEQTFSEMKSLEFAVAKKDKTAELIAAGVAEDVIASAISEIATIEDLSVAVDKLLTDNTVTESVKDDADDVDLEGTRKSAATVAPVVAPEQSMVNFSKVWNSI